MSLCGCFKHIHTHTQVINKQKVLKDKHNQNLDDEEKFVIYNFWDPLFFFCTIALINMAFHYSLEFILNFHADVSLHCSVKVHCQSVTQFETVA